MRIAFVLVLAAALLRVAWSAQWLDNWAVAGSSLAWSVAFLLYIARFGAYLVRPSLPR
jgi:uncharacterized protein involved in response to NO